MFIGTPSNSHQAPVQGITLGKWLVPSPTIA